MVSESKPKAKTIVVNIRKDEIPRIAAQCMGPPARAGESILLGRGQLLEQSLPLAKPRPLDPLPVAR